MVRQKIIKIDAGKIKMRRLYSADELLKCGVINLAKPKGPKCKIVLDRL